MENLVSIIVPAYNVENYLERCLNSLLNQTYQNIEVLLINDGSKDNTLSIAGKYSCKDSRIKVINQENQGVSAARNNGLSQMKGAFFTFVDADDYVSENYIKILLNNLTSSNADISICSTCRSNKSDKQFVDETNAKCVYTPEEVLIEAYQKRKIDVTVSGKLYRASKLATTRFDQTLRLGEDQVYFVESLKLAKTIVFENTNLYCYFERSGSATHSVFDEKYLDCFVIGEYFSKARSFFSPTISGLFTKMEVFLYVAYYAIGAKANNEASKKIARLLRPRIKSSNAKTVLSYCNKKDKLRYCAVKYFPFLSQKGYWLLGKIQQALKK